MGNISAYYALRAVSVQLLFETRLKQYRKRHVTYINVFGTALVHVSVLLTGRFFRINPPFIKRSARELPTFTRMNFSARRLTIV